MEMRLIDADKLQERAYQMRFSTRITEGGLALINYLLSEEPTVDPVKHGRWIFEEYPDGYYHAICSECDVWSDEYAYLDGWNYCPHCGAKMDEVEE